MNNFYCFFTGGLLLAAGSAAAQKPALGPLRPVQTITLGARSALGGTVQLANHNTVLLLTDTDAPTVRAQCLAPDGHTLWEVALDRYQRLRPNEFSIFNPLGNVAVGHSAKDAKLAQEQQLAADLRPVSVLTEGNNVLLVERINGGALKNQPKNSILHDGQVYVQRLDEQGRLSKALFEPRPGPDSKKTEAVTLGRYAEATGYVEIVRETNNREESLVFCTMHYNLLTKTVRREPLELPATPEHVGNFNSFRHWYQEWAYLGHRPNQTYFCRRTVVGAPKEKAGNQPVVYQVYLADDQGAAAPGGFSTTLGLSKGTMPAYSGSIPSFGELNHIPRYYTQKMGSSYVEFDEWSTSTGGLGSFYLDRGTGDVLIFGEYSKGSLPEVEYKTDLLGYFEHRYAFDGKPLGQLQSPYDEAMRAKKKKASFTGQYFRQIRFHLDPLNGQTQYSFSAMQIFGRGEDFDLFIDNSLKMQRYEYLSGKDKDERLYTSVRYTEPFWVYKSGGSAADLRIYEHAAKGDLPVYAALEQLRRTAGPKAADFEFHLSATGPGTGLVVERRQSVGGSLQVYKF